MVPVEARRRTVPPPTVLTRPGDEPTAAALLAAAVEVMAVNGYHGSSVRDIASAAGTSPAVLYHHYESKQGLLVRLCDRGLDVLLRATEDALDDAGPDPADRLGAIVEAHVRVHMDSQRESLIGNSELRALEAPGRALVVAKRDAQQRLFDRVVRDGVRSGRFTTAHPDEASRFITTACTGVATWYRRGGPLTDDDVVTRHRAIALDAVGCGR
ncbi:TetR family transcriptional regulator [Actinomycetospora termitidis]|uniref:TetR family transcriptional regulator n=1 Tax=Actinomycetospora termitidis TaxID=3053470 RepID=A0ABT7MDZ3_9PSEU|nr:TetR family transcriptional regulator [Actinomycetospora sp. Odt1-22]MDL5158886.1 TetR family transcriptional regulator [Actinomycetospora sp. Odt1-22]